MLENLDSEIWKDINGYEGFYQVSNMGRIKSLSRYRWFIHDYQWTKEKILKTTKDKKGYTRIGLCVDSNVKLCLVHRLVAKAFLPNPNNYLIINHKDEVPSNNRVDNLEWCTSEYNSNYGNRNKKISENNIKGGKNKGANNSQARSVICLDTLEIFSTIKEACNKYGLKTSNSIIDNIKGRKKSAGKHLVTGEHLHWLYYEDWDCSLK